jgi:peptidyl-prolyl cis-trans isomerase C
MNITEADLEAHIREGLILQALVDRVIVANINITDDQTKNFYADNPNLFQQPHQVRASHILIKLAPDADEATQKAAKEKVAQVQERLNGGEDFAAVAKALSEGPSSGNGGDLGFFGKGKMVKPFEDAVFSMKVGDVSDTVQTQFGYHIITVTGEKPSRKLAYDEVKTDITRHLKNNQVKVELNAYIEKLKASAQIEKK